MQLRQMRIRAASGDAERLKLCVQENDDLDFGPFLSTFVWRQRGPCGCARREDRSSAEVSFRCSLPPSPPPPPHFASHLHQTNSRELTEKPKTVVSSVAFPSLWYRNSFLLQELKNMTGSLEKAVAQKKGLIEAMIDMFEKGTEVLASTVGDLFPFCEVVVPVVKLALGKVQSQEVFYVKEQFLIVKNKLDILSSQQIDINHELEKANLDSQYFSVEENIRNQFRKFLDFLEAKEEFKEVKKDIFLKHFSKSGGEKNLWILHDAVMGTSEPILEVVERYVARNRRLLEDFCVRLKELLCLGLIALMGHCALTAQSQEEEQENIQEWSQKVEEIENKMKSVIESCIAAFPEQAQSDVKRLLQEKEEGNLQPVAEELLEFLVKKFDWVCWSVRLINHPDGFFKKHCTGKPFHHVAGRTQFEVLQGSNTSLVVSYSINPQPVPRDDIQQVMEGQGRKGNPAAVVEMLEKQLCGFVIHVVSCQSKSECVWSFPEDCHYWEKHKNGVVCVHFE